MLNNVVHVDSQVNIFFVNLVKEYPILLNFFSKVTFFGSFLFAVYVCIFFTAIILIFAGLSDSNLSLKKYLLPFWITIILSSTITYLLKIFLQRVGPSGRHLLEIDPSFPSGHATLATAFFGIIYFLYKNKFKSRSSRFLFLVWTIFIILLVGISRLILNVHFFSDVIAGYVVGTFGIWLGIFVSKKLN